MINCHIRHLHQRCFERGYTLAEVEPCIVSRNGDEIVVDETHSAYPRPRHRLHQTGAQPPKRRPRFAQTSPPPPHIATNGPGTELKTLLGRIGIHATPNCACNNRMYVMNEKGCDWCEKNIDEISGWLKEEATRRKLPYIDFAGKTLIRLAIKRARKKEQHANQTPPHNPDT
jgi:hypothetical protein